MIQRKQTLWLLIVVIAAFLTIKFPFYTGNIVEPSNLKSFQIVNARYNLAILIITITIAITSLIAIFLYSQRKKQMFYIALNILMSIATIVLYYSETKKFVDGDFSIFALLSLFIPISLLFAFIGVFKDERLIKSLDRIR